MADSSPLDRLDDPRIKQIPLSRWPDALDRPSVGAQELALRVMTEAALSEEGVRELTQTAAIEKVARLMDSDSDIIAMYACWFVSNMSATSDDSVRIAFGKAGVLSIYPKLLQSENPLLLEKAFWSITNMAQTPVIRKAMALKGVSGALIDLLKRSGVKERKNVLQPLINLLLDDEFHKTFYEAKAIDAVVELLSSEDEASVTVALTALLYLSVSLEEARVELVQSQNILMQLSTILESSSSEPLRDLILQVLTNLSYSDSNEIPLAESGILLSVIDILSSSSPTLQSRAAMLLANVALNQTVRDKIRLFGWAEPALKLALSDNADVQLQILRFLLNISLHPFCRKLLVDANAGSRLSALLSDLPALDERMELLVSTLTNLNAPIPQDVLDQFKAELHAPAVAPVQISTPAAVASPPPTESPATGAAAAPANTPAAGSKPSWAVGSAKQAATQATQPTAAAPAADKGAMVLDAANAPMYARREKVARELLQTEQKYMATLQAMRDDFVVPLRNMAITPRGVFTDDEIHKLFSVTELLANIHQTFYKKLEARIKDWKWDSCVADLFLDMGEMLKAYKPYINNYDVALQFYSSVAMKKKQWQSFLKEAQQKHPELASSGLPHFLIQPIQRVPRYVLLLDQLVKFTPTSHVDHENLEIALDKIKKITEYLNEAKRNAENVNKILDIENTVAGINGSLMLVGRRFIKEGTAIEDRKGGSRTCVIYLFNDILIYCKLIKKGKRVNGFDYQYQVLRHIPLSDIQSVTVPDDDAKAKLHIQCKPDGEWPGTVVLTFTTSEERDSWMNSISSARNSALAKILRERRASVAAGVAATPPDSPSKARSSGGASNLPGVKSPPPNPMVRSGSSDKIASPTPTAAAAAKSPTVVSTPPPASSSPAPASAPATPTSPTQHVGTVPAIMPTIPGMPAFPGMPQLPMTLPSDPAQATQMQMQMQMQIQAMAHMLAMMQMQGGGAAPGTPGVPTMPMMPIPGMPMIPGMPAMPMMPQPGQPSAQQPQQPPPGQ